MQRFTKTKLFVVLVASAIFGLIVYFNPVSASNSIRSGLSVFTLPFQKVFYSFSVNVQNTMDFLSSIGEIKKENEQLIREKQELVAENASLKEVGNENELLREQLNLLPRARYDLVPAFIVSEDPGNSGNWIEIDRGSEDGMTEGMPVIVSKGILVGKIKDVGLKSSKVILLTNPTSAVNAMTLENSSKGVAKGEYGLGIIFDMVLQTDSIQAGDNVVTSGIGGEIPRGLYVGKVQEVRPSDDHLFQQAIVISPIQPSKLKIVFVVKGVKQ
ncbi:MAG TPA: rod shape-determining protein MreC [Candidatus Moranbacteria bacterium]|jgi:rod shape-determining protein MreC|nr:rod shape-determining protein MreC [Candidatus Moranbacteria bacterium]HOF42753.1 rod shape-determining protein MreC [Candidatus Moranbacteria bacterium]HPX94000.1 rod shape-determining protein MreC [Candidatus Moranbacteria bacterium]HQB59273.1 rod shape-determining protein MreC [Candidatus Moranbacteria bacterium]